MDREENEVKELFAQYGLLIYIAQTIEKLLITLSIGFTNITRSRFDEIYYEKSQLPFGLLKKELYDTNIFTPEELERLDEFNSLRNDLVHHFWWDRSVEFAVEELRGSIKAELYELKVKFNSIDELVHMKADQLAKVHNLDIDAIEDELIRSGVTPQMETFRKLRKEETLLDVKRYRLSQTSSIPIFILEDSTYWTVCESGLTQYKQAIDFSKVEDIALLEGVFPVKQFNPRPKKVDDWHYDLLLKTQKLQVGIRPAYKVGTITFSWSINKAK